MGNHWQTQYAYNYRMHLQPWEPGYDDELKKVLQDEKEEREWQAKSDVEKFQEWRLLREAARQHEMHKK